MKRLSKFFVATVLLLVFTSVVMAQNKKATVEWDVVWDYWLDVECGGITDNLIGPVTAHVVTHYNKDGEIINTIFHTTGMVSSTETGEVFMVNEVSWDDFAGTSIDFQFNIRGNQGSHYVGRGIWDYVPGDWDTGVLTLSKFVCPGSKRNNP
jgi:hypothetical protein